MITIILNIIGLICILISLVFIKRNLKKEMDMYEEIILIHNNVKDYSTAIDNTLSSFDALMEASLKKIETMGKNVVTNDVYKTKMSKSIENSNSYNENSKIILEEPITNNMTRNKSYNKILDLKKIGLSNEEIAKNLNMGIREVEIILKIWNNR
mgnify:CR=1 FL=1